MPFFGFDGSSRGATREMHRGCDPLIDAVGIHLSARAEGAEQARLSCLSASVRLNRGHLRMFGIGGCLE
jgi:hypothetical protein